MVGAPLTLPLPAAAQAPPGTTEGLPAEFTEPVLMTSAISTETIDKPTKPRRLRVTSTTESSITIAWNSPKNNGGSTIIGYRVEVSTTGTGNWRVLAGTTPFRFYTHNGLGPERTRYYRVSAKNADGTGPRSATKSGTTDSADPGPTVTIAALSSSVTEGTAVGFRLTRAPAGNASLTVALDVSETGDMLGGYLPANAVFAASEGTVTITLGTTNDTEDEPDSDVTVEVSSGTGYAVGSNSSATVTVTDNDAAAATVPGSPRDLRVSASRETRLTLAWRAPSDNGGASIEGYAIERSATGNNPWTNADLSVVNAWVDSNLQPGTTYYYRVSAINSVGTGPASGVASGTTEGSEVEPTVTIEAISSPVAEGSLARFLVTRTPAASTALTIRTDISETGAMLPGGLLTTFTLAAGNTTVTLDLATVDDTRHEPDSDITVTVLSADGYQVGSASSATVTVTDNDPEPEPEPTVTISALSSSVTEGTDAGFRLSRTLSTSASLTVSVDVSETGGMLSGTPPTVVTFSTGDRTVTLSVATTDDARDEPDSDITVTVSAGTGYTVGSPSSAMVTATDNDVAVTVPGAPRRLQVTADGQTAIDIAWRAPSSNGGAPVTGYRIEVSTDDQSWTDLVANTGSSATSYEHAGLSPGTKRYYRVSAINSAGAGPASNVASATTETPAIPVVTIAAVSSPVTEGTAAAFELTRDTRGSPLTVQVDVTEAGAMRAGNAPSSVNFPANANKATLSVATTDDARHEPDSDITVTVLSGDGYQAGSASSAAVTVTDNDPEAAPKVTIAAVSSPVTEGTAARFELTRDIVGDGPLTVQVDVSETGRMLSGTPPTVVTFSTGDRTVTLSVATTDDARDEPDSDITVTVSAGTGYTVGRPSTATVTATDNDITVRVPGAPRRLQVTADGQTALDIAWRAPSSNGGAPVTGYRIEVSTDNAELDRSGRQHRKLGHLLRARRAERRDDALLPGLGDQLRGNRSGFECRLCDDGDTRDTGCHDRSRVESGDRGYSGCVRVDPGYHRQPAHRSGGRDRDRSDEGRKRTLFGELPGKREQGDAQRGHHRRRSARTGQ